MGKFGCALDSILSLGLGLGGAAKLGKLRRRCSFSTTAQHFTFHDLTLVLQKDKEIYVQTRDKDIYIGDIYGKYGVLARSIPHWASVVFHGVPECWFVALMGRVQCSNKSAFCFLLSSSRRNHLIVGDRPIKSCTFCLSYRETMWFVSVADALHGCIVCYECVQICDIIGGILICFDVLFLLFIFHLSSFIVPSLPLQN